MEGDCGCKHLIVEEFQVSFFIFSVVLCCGTFELFDFPSQGVDNVLLFLESFDKTVHL